MLALRATSLFASRWYDRKTNLSGIEWYGLHRSISLGLGQMLRWLAAAVLVSSHRSQVVGHRSLPKLGAKTLFDRYSLLRGGYEYDSANGES